ncbi:MAG TPA: adenosylcobinamide-GDP ribazoletransferase [Methylomirabilota bacterium]
MKGLLEAARYLTAVPLGNGTPQGPETRRGVAWFPVVGLGIGAVLALTDRLATAVFPPLVSAALTVTVWKLITGGLHADGLADCLDSLAGHDRGQRLDIMSDSRIGAFAALGLALFLVLETAAVAGLGSGDGWRVLLAVPAIGRVTPAVLSRCFPPARATGQGATFSAGLKSRDMPIALVGAAAIAGLALGWIGLLALAIAILAALGTGRFFSARLGGITGDVLGAGVELGELAAVLTMLAWTNGPR